MATDHGFAPAKINLTLHVTGRRSDGYHLLDSLVAFADVGDRVRAAPQAGLSLTLTGPESAGLAADDDNLVLRAARLLGILDARLTLDKVLPVASGIGGGSADAAATLRVLARQTGRDLPSAAATLALGADVPVCLHPQPTRMRGIGEHLTPVPGLPGLAVVLVNPRIAVPTPEVFRHLAERENPPMPETLPVWHDADDLIAFLATCRNDLQAPAIRIAPVISAVLALLAAQQDCRLARMSGSGATCFGLFDRPDTARAAAASVLAAHPGWWVAAARLLA